MAKHINVDELFTKLDMIGNPDSEFATDDYIDGFSDGVSAAMKVVEEATPAADVVEVVRCKDCMHYDFIENYCDLLGCDLPGDLFYCHDGAKMDGGEGE